MTPTKVAEPVPILRRSERGHSARLAFWDWLRHYHQADLAGDIMAGLIVAITLVPQSIAYPTGRATTQAGLYA
jgi:MFS superfamily sulfate permease-like transporter